MAIDAYRDQYLRYVRELVGAVGDPPAPTETAYPDTAGDTFLAPADPHFDLLSVGLANDQADLLGAVTVAGPIDVGGSTDQCRIMWFFDTRAGGSTSNPWGRQISTPYQADYFLGSWTDSGGGFIFYEWNGSGWDQLHASFNNPGGISQDLSEKTDGIARYTVPLADLGLSDTDDFFFDVVTTNDRGAGFEPGLDHLSNPSQATPDYNTASVAGSYPQHTLTPFDPGAGAYVDGPFTLPPREAHIDALHTLIAPYAFLGSFSGGNSDYGYTTQSFHDSFTLPASYAGGGGWVWGVKPYIEARTDYLRQNVAAPTPLPRVFVNEVLALNETIITDEAGQYEDFVELYNDEDVAVDVSGMYLTDDPAFPLQWQIPSGTVIPAKGFLLVWADNDPADGPLHATFKLSSSGETVALFHNDAGGNVLLDSLTYASLDPDESFGRYPDGSDDLQAFCAVTPEGPNDDDDSCYTDPDPTPAVYVNEWLASNDGVITDEFGDADDMIELYNDENVAVDLGGRYLTDDLADRTKWEIPAGVIIPAKGRLVFWADDETEQGPMHTNFKLSAGGEAVGLFDRTTNQLAEIDAVTFGAQTTDVSEGRSPDGAECLATFTPSPGTANPAGPADVNADGVLNLDDINAFAIAFIGNDLAADCDGSGVLNLDDVNCFATGFLNPCP
ncbi:MAG: lamin tail domain-containing protein [Phycisphaerales bacterium]